LQVDLAAAWKPYDRQARFITSDALFSLFLGGVGSGKSHALCCWVLRRALANGAATGALLGRTSIDLQTVLLPCFFDRLQELQDQSGINWMRDYDKGNVCLRLINGAVVYFRPYNRIAKLRGLTLTYAAADEVEWSEADPDEVHTTLSGRLRGKGPLPGLAYATSPNGLRGITKRFHDMQLAALDAQSRGDTAALADAQRFYVVTSTSFDNPYLPPHFFESLRSMSKRRYEQEALGRVLRPTSAVFEIEARHVVDWDWRAHRKLPWVLAADWGAQSHHVALMLQVTAAGRWIVADELVVDDEPQGRFLDRLFRWIDQRGDPALAGVDRAVPACNQPLQQRYRRTPVRWMESRHDQQVVRGIEALRDMLDPVDGEPRLVFARSLRPVHTGETAPILPAVRGYRYVMGPDGVPTNRPCKDNVHDHAVDALRYGVCASSGRAELHGGRMWHLDLGALPPAKEGPGHSTAHTHG
jgi:hypothetical protein